MHDIRHFIRIVESEMSDTLYHGTASATLMFIVSENRLMTQDTHGDQYGPGFSLTRNFDVAKDFADRSVGNVTQFGDPDEPAYQCEIELQTEGVVLVYSRAVLISRFGKNSLINVSFEGSEAWSKQGFSEADEEEERLLSKTDWIANTNDLIQKIIPCNKEKFEVFLSQMGKIKRYKKAVQFIRSKFC